jgi:hypothetical protein
MMLLSSPKSLMKKPIRLPSTRKGSRAIDRFWTERHERQRVEEWKRLQGEAWLFGDAPPLFLDRFAELLQDRRFFLRMGD